MATVIFLTAQLLVTAKAFYNSNLNARSNDENRRKYVFTYLSIYLKSSLSHEFAQFDCLIYVIRDYIVSS